MTIGVTGRNALAWSVKGVPARARGMKPHHPSRRAFGPPQDEASRRAFGLLQHEASRRRLRLFSSFGKRRMRRCVRPQPHGEEAPRAVSNHGGRGCVSFVRNEVPRPAQIMAERPAVKHCMNRFAAAIALHLTARPGSCRASSYKKYVRLFGRPCRVRTARTDAHRSRGSASRIRLHRARPRRR